MNFQKLAGGAPVESALAELQAQPELWNHTTLRQTFPGTAHGDTRTIFLRSPSLLDVGTVEEIHNDIVALDDPALDQLPECAYFMYGIAGLMRARRLGRVMVVNLVPGGVIAPHVDQGAYADHYSRYHLPLQSDEGNIFTVAGEKVHMKPGELWWFNHHAEHTVANRSTRDRLHLIVDLVRKP